jgi:hypothetical protein
LRRLRIYNKKIIDMDNIKGYESFRSSESDINESFWNSIFGKPTIKAATRDALKTQEFSVRGEGERSEDNYIVFNGKKFYPDQIQYDDYHSTKELPRVEGNLLIIANPAWSL